MLKSSVMKAKNPPRTNASSSNPTPNSETAEQERHFVSVSGKPFYVPAMTVVNFCETYDLGENIRNRLEDEEFRTAGSILEVSEATLYDAGFKGGQIAEIKKALKELLNASN
ncbi:hypothetical protein R3P38DRAFT_3075390 [Favolaschia claudopus]|uniref:SAM domain-containing protein n=1 Tax=Favolaschia claudopus TaxID=2862362 RepID=A0AAV9ZXM6_9AGAR